jgi:hypothetical protein
MCLHGEALQLKTFSITYLPCSKTSPTIRIDRSCTFFEVRLSVPLEGRNKLRTEDLTGRMVGAWVVIEQSVALL